MDVMRGALNQSRLTSLSIGLFWLAIAMCLMSYGCAGAVGGGTGNSSGSSTLTLIPATVSFGNVNTGSNATQTATISNPTASPISIGNVGISGAGFSVSGAPAGLTLAAGQTAQLTVTFSPASAGTVTGNVTITAPSEPSPLVIALSGTGVAVNAHSVTLTWSASSSSVAGYRAYRATASAGPYTMMNSAPNPQLRYSDSTVQAGTTYYYVVTALASDGTESGQSSQVTAVVPKP
jgi:hypothetical protein